MDILKGNNVIIREGVHIGKNVILEDDVYIDYNCIIRDNVTIKRGSFIGANCIIGEYQADFFVNYQDSFHPVVIGEYSRIRSGSVIYGDVEIGDHFQSGHRIGIRENVKIGNHVSIGTNSEIQSDCIIGNYVHAQYGVEIAPFSVIEDFVWIFVDVVFTNDPTPPSYDYLGITVKKFAVLASGCVLMPGITVEEDTLVAGGAIVTKDVKKGTVVAGNPAKVIKDIYSIRNHKTGEPVYPWRYTFKRGLPWEKSGYDEWIKEDGECRD